MHCQGKWITYVFDMSNELFNNYLKIKLIFHHYNCTDEAMGLSLNKLLHIKNHNNYDNYSFFYKKNIILFYPSFSFAWMCVWMFLLLDLFIKYIILF